MSLDDEAKEIRDVVAKMRRRSSRAVRRRVLDWIQRAENSGVHLKECCRTVGIDVRRVFRWREQEERILATQVPKPEIPRATAVTKPLPIMVREDLLFGPCMAFVTPSGFRIEGLTLDQAIGLMKAFA